MVVSGAALALVDRRLVALVWDAEAALVPAQAGRVSAAAGGSLAFEDGLLAASAFTLGALLSTGRTMS